MVPHDSLVQQLVSEAWRRIDGYDFTNLLILYLFFAHGIQLISKLKD